VTHVAAMNHREHSSVERWLSDRHHALALVRTLTVRGPSHVEGVMVRRGISAAGPLRRNMADGSVHDTRRSRWECWCRSASSPEHWAGVEAVLLAAYAHMACLPHFQ
jgi:hypothetical protein